MKANYFGFFFSFFISTLFYYEGFLKIVGFNVSSGSGNPIFFVFLILSSFGLWLKVGKVDIISFSCLTFLIFVMLLVFFIKGVYFYKLVRDVFSISSLYFLLVLFDHLFYKNSRKLDKRQFFLSLWFFVSVFYPAIGFAFNIQSYGDRFSGFMLSPTLFSCGVLVVYMAVRFNVNLGLLSVILYLVSFGLIFASGTRSSLFVLIAFEVLFIFNNKYERHKYLSYILLLCGSATLLWLVNGSAEVMIEPLSSPSITLNRVLSVDDIKTGSLNTRLTWYLLLVDSLRENSFFVGGLGAGASEAKIGFITHFDFLRFWYDYSIFFVLAFLFLIYYFYLKQSLINVRNVLRDWRRLTFLSIFSLNIILLSMHNAFQTPSFLMLLAIYIVTINDIGESIGNEDAM